MSATGHSISPYGAWRTVLSPGEPRPRLGWSCTRPRSVCPCRRHSPSLQLRIFIIDSGALSMGTIEQRGRRRRARRYGAAAVEMAFIAPVLFTLVLGIIEFGRVMMVEEVLNNAAREACRKAVLEGSTTADARTTASTYMSNATVPLSNAANQVTVSPDPSTAGPGTAITVTI